MACDMCDTCIGPQVLGQGQSLLEAILGNKVVGAVQTSNCEGQTGDICG
jgi:hypothetical protein